MVAGTGLVTSPAAAVTTQKRPVALASRPGRSSSRTPAPTGSGGAGTGPGSVTLYGPGVRGNAETGGGAYVGIHAPGGVATDSSGDLGSQPVPPGTVVEYAKSELAEASPVPTVTIRCSTARSNSPLTPQGTCGWITGKPTLWSSREGAVARSGSPEPRVPLRVNPDDRGVAFDPSGNLWEGSDEDWLSESTKAELTRSGAAVPQVTIRSDTLAAPAGRRSIASGTYG